MCVQNWIEIEGNIVVTVRTLEDERGDPEGEHT